MIALVDEMPLRLFNGDAFYTFGGTMIRVSRHLTVRKLHARSPSRARRRERLGHRQNYISAPDPKVYQIQGALYMHPDTYRALRGAVVDQQRARGAA